MGQQNTMRIWNSTAVQIAASGTYSAEIVKGAYAMVAVKIPAVITGTNLMIQACEVTDGTFATVCNDSAIEISVDVSSIVGKWFVLPPEVAMFPFIKLYFANSSNIAQVQAAERELVILLMS